MNPTYSETALQDGSNRNAPGRSIVFKDAPSVTSSSSDLPVYDNPNSVTKDHKPFAEDDDNSSMSMVGRQFPRYLNGNPFDPTSIDDEDLYSEDESEKKSKLEPVYAKADTSVRRKKASENDTSTSTPADTQGTEIHLQPQEQVYVTDGAFHHVQKPPRESQMDDHSMNLPVYSSPGHQYEDEGDIMHSTELNQRGPDDSP